MTLPTDGLIYQFDNGTVVYTNEHSVATGKTMPKLRIMLLDAYRFSWELTIEYRYRPGDSKDLFWEGHIYCHPGMRNVQELTQKVGQGMILRILELCKDHPSLIFNSQGQPNGQARHEGFMHMALPLLMGAEFTTKLLP